ncbi:uncharacterized protein I206_103653 [Kwoniella pini CBS 10737]|uniref:Uncharacterized protein n=1 Tax=Kwoniella pini CBS 10737 TaxID=1296096 RepID=A0A1B9I952_9TREE|nr:uncharacterized protein I206_01344 [Kwoniella pini CBS 10737]OCF52060.1 hypothetical protein I206_01344 [Kwoniella pini CBS 10737]
MPSSQRSDRKSKGGGSSSSASGTSKSTFSSRIAKRVPGGKIDSTMLAKFQQHADVLLDCASASSAGPSKTLADLDTQYDLMTKVQQNEFERKVYETLLEIGIEHEVKTQELMSDIAPTKLSNDSLLQAEIFQDLNNESDEEWSMSGKGEGEDEDEDTKMSGM